jgi:hypothetical protein
VDTLKPNRSELFWGVAISLDIVLAAACWLGYRWHREEGICERRGAALDARIERIRESVRQIIPGTNKDAIVGVLEANGLRASFLTTPYVPTIEGTATADGCSRILGCGDQVVIMVEVRVDDRWAAIETPRVETFLDDCM